MGLFYTSISDGTHNLNASWLHLQLFNCMISLILPRLNISPLVEAVKSVILSPLKTIERKPPASHAVYSRYTELLLLLLINVAVVVDLIYLCMKIIEFHSHRWY